MLSKNILLLILGLSISVLLFIGIAISMLLTQPTPQQGTTLNPTPTLYPTIILPSPVTKGIVPFAQKESEKMLDALETRAPLSSEDLIVKNKLLTITSAKSGTIHQTPTYIISYLRAADVFQVEILSTEVVNAKKSAVFWLTDQGFSIKAICTLPVTFYLNFSVSNQLKNTGFVFSPIAQECS